MDSVIKTILQITVSEHLIEALDPEWEKLLQEQTVRELLGYDICQEETEGREMEEFKLLSLLNIDTAIPNNEDKFRELLRVYQSSVKAVLQEILKECEEEISEEFEKEDQLLYPLNKMIGDSLIKKLRENRSVLSMFCNKIMEMGDPLTLRLVYSIHMVHGLRMALDYFPSPAISLKDLKSMSKAFNREDIEILAHIFAYCGKNLLGSLSNAKALSYLETVANVINEEDTRKIVNDELEKIDCGNALRNGKLLRYLWGRISKDRIGNEEEKQAFDKLNELIEPIGKALLSLAGKDSLDIVKPTLTFIINELISERRILEIATCYAFLSDGLHAIPSFRWELKKDEEDQLSELDGGFMLDRDFLRKNLIGEREIPIFYEITSWRRYSQEKERKIKKLIDQPPLENRIPLILVLGYGDREEGECKTEYTDTGDSPRIIKSDLCRIGLVGERYSLYNKIISRILKHKIETISLPTLTPNP